MNSGRDGQSCPPQLEPLPDRSFHTTRRRLPHWHLAGATYYVTFRLFRGLLTREEEDIVLNHIRNGDDRFYGLAAVIVMPDHVHVVLDADRGFDITRIMRGIRGMSARLVNLHRHSRGTLWQSESYDRILGSTSEVIGVLRYMLNNPVRASLSNDPWRYHGWYCCEKYTKFL